MLLTKLPFGIDWKHKTCHIYHDNDEAEQITIDENGNGELLLDMFKSLDLTPLKGFIEELNELLTKEQKQAIFQLWGNSKQIMLSDMNRIVDRILAKQILGLGMDRGVLTRGVNSTWRVIDKEIQKTMKESAERMKRGPIKGAPSFEESIERLQKQGFPSMGEGGMIASKDRIARKESSIFESPIEIVREEPINPVEKSTHIVHSSLKVNISLLRKELEKLQKQYDDPNRIDNETCNTFTLIDRMKILKVQIANAEITQSQGQYTQGTKLIASGSVTQVERVEQREVQKKESNNFSFPQKKIFTKEKPSSRSPVVKKK
jgi:hypothetical protein